MMRGQVSIPHRSVFRLRTLSTLPAFFAVGLVVSSFGFAQMPTFTTSSSDTRTVTLMYEQPNTVVAPSDVTVSGTSALGSGGQLFKSPAAQIEYVFADGTTDLFADIVQVGTSSTDVINPYEAGLWRNAGSAGLAFGILDADGADDDNSFVSFTRDSNTWHTVYLTGEADVDEDTVWSDPGTGVHTRDIKFGLQQVLQGPDTNFSDDITVRFTVMDAN